MAARACVDRSLIVTLPRSVADVIADHVSFEVECVDRMYLNLYVPRLQFPNGIAHFFREHRRMPFVSSALMDPMTKEFVAAIHRYIKDHDLPLVEFRKGQRKDDIAHEHLAASDGREGILFVGRAQEKTSTFRTVKRRNPITRASYPWIVPATALVNHFYCYGLDDDFGPFFLKFGTYFPYTAKVCINGHHWAQRQAAKAGIGFEALDNGFLSADDPEHLQRLCRRLDARKIDAFVRKWLARLPHPFTPADRRAGYRYDISVLQAEFSLTQVLDRPASGRVFFEEVIRENLDIGRPDHIGLVFDRRIMARRRYPTPGRFRTRVLTEGVIPSLHVDYKSSRIKQYFKEGRALRTETTVNDTRDFEIGTRLINLADIAHVGFAVNHRLLDVETISHDPYPGEEAITQITAPTIVDGQRAAALRFPDPRTQALLGVLLVFRLLPRGFSARELRDHLAPLLGLHPDTMTQGKLSYDLRRLRLHGLIERIPHTRRYRVTTFGLHSAVILTRTYNRLLRPATALATGPPLTQPAAIQRDLARLDTTLDRLARHGPTAA
jgi:hypothetical protein